MPEGLEVELYRRAAKRAIGRPIDTVVVDGRQQLAHEIESVLPGRTIRSARRTGKVLILDLADVSSPKASPQSASSVGIHFGMTGRLVVDGVAAIGELEYSSGRDDPAWDRLTITFDDGGVLRINDPRRWARFTLDPTSSGLGPDFLSVGAEYLLRVFARRQTPVKATLLDQSVVAGYGNMCVDEVLWQTGIAPITPSRDVSADAVERLVAFAPLHLRRMLRRGGSHRGTISPQVRAHLPPCPRDGAPMRREQVGGRTTIWCPAHQQTRVTGRGRLGPA